MSRLDELQLDLRLGRREYERRLKHAQRRLAELRLILGGQIGSGELGPGLLIVLRAPTPAARAAPSSASSSRSTLGTTGVGQFATPTLDEKRHHFLWRFYREIPGMGGMAVFDRSWYGRILVERVEGFATEEQWSRAYDEILQFESTLVLEGMILSSSGCTSARTSSCGASRAAPRSAAGAGS